MTQSFQGKMVHGLVVNTQPVVPLRGVGAVTAGCITPLEIAQAVGDWNPFERRHFPFELTVQRLDKGNIVYPVYRRECEQMLQDIAALSQRREPYQAQLRCIPPGLFVYRRELEDFIEQVNQVHTEPHPYGPGMPAIKIQDHPMCSANDLKLYVEGFESIVHEAVGQPKSGRQRRLERIAGLLNALERQAQAAGIEFDRGRLPQTVSDLVKLIKRMAPELRALTDETIVREYFPDLGVKVRPGRSKVDAPLAPLYRLM